MHCQISTRWSCICNGVFYLASVVISSCIMFAFPKWSTSVCFFWAVGHWLSHTSLSLALGKTTDVGGHFPKESRPTRTTIWYYTPKAQKVSEDFISSAFFYLCWWNCWKGHTASVKREAISTSSSPFTSLQMLSDIAFIKMLFGAITIYTAMQCCLL